MFEIGDRVINKWSGVKGNIIKIYKPTACEEQTMVITDDGRKYHAPTREWKLVQEDEARGYVNDEMAELLSPYGKYLCVFAKNHNISIQEATEQPMIKARLDYFNKTVM